MNKKLMLLAAGALAALAFTALPSAASATEAELLCEAGSPCSYSVAGGESRFSLHNGDTVWCTSVTGNGAMTGLVNNEATTGEVQLLFHGCKEQSTIFHFGCSNTGTSGTVTTNKVVTHNIKIPTEAKPKTQGVLLTGINVTFTCAGGFAATRVTGNVIGDLENECGVTSKTLNLDFTMVNHGTQTFRTWTGKTFDLEGSTNHGPYETAAQTGTGTLTFNQGVIPTC